MNLPLATYNGLEVDMLSVGDADSTLVTRWTNGVPTRVLIDGGNKSSASTLKLFLLRRRIRYVDHIVCTHPHDDHAAGLIELVTDKRFDFGMFWMHLPWKHVNLQTLDEALRRTSARRVAKIIDESLQRSRNLADAVWCRKPYIYQPFAGHQVGFLTVCGPSEKLYGTLVSEFEDADKLAQFESDLASHDRTILMEAILRNIEASARADGSLGAEPTEPENDSSVILATKFASYVFVFTSDAGLPAFIAVKILVNPPKCFILAPDGGKLVRVKFTDLVCSASSVQLGENSVKCITSREDQSERTEAIEEDSKIERDFVEYTAEVNNIRVKLLADGSSSRLQKQLKSLRVFAFAHAFDDEAALLAKTQGSKPIEDSERLFAYHARDALRPSFVRRDFAFSGVQVSQPLAQKSGHFPLLVVKVC